MFARPKSVWKNCHRPSLILSTPQLADDFYSQPISWGLDQIVIALPQRFVTFPASAPHNFVDMTAEELLGQPSSTNTRVFRSALVTRRDGSAWDEAVFLGTSSSQLAYCSIRESAVVLNRKFGLSAAAASNNWLAMDDSGCGATNSFTSHHNDDSNTMADDILGGGGPSRGFTCLAKCPGRHHEVVAGAGDGTLSIFDTRTRSPAPVIQFGRRPGSFSGKAHGGSGVGCGSGPVAGVAVDPSSGMIASGGNDGSVHIWNPAAGFQPVVSMQRGPSAVRALSWCPSKRGLLAVGGGSADGTLSCVDCTGAVSPDQVNSATMNGNCRAAMPSCRAAVSTGSQIAQVLWSHDGQFLVSSHGYEQQSLPGFDEELDHPSSLLSASACGVVGGPRGAMTMTHKYVPAMSVAVWRLKSSGGELVSAGVSANNNNTHHSATGHQHQHHHPSASAASGNYHHTAGSTAPPSTPVALSNFAALQAILVKERTHNLSTPLGTPQRPPSLIVAPFGRHNNIRHSQQTSHAATSGKNNNNNNNNGDDVENNRNNAARDNNSSNYIDACNLSGSSLPRSHRPGWLDVPYCDDHDSGSHNYTTSRVSSSNNNRELSINNNNNNNFRSSRQSSSSSLFDDVLVATADYYHHHLPSSSAAAAGGGGGDDGVISGRHAASGAAGGSNGVVIELPMRLDVVTHLYGHTARPLFLAQRQRATGEFVSGGGGADATVRLWELFEEAESDVNFHQESAFPGGGAAKRFSSSASGSTTIGGHNYHHHHHQSSNANGFQLGGGRSPMMMGRGDEDEDDFVGSAGDDHHSPLASLNRFQSLR